MRKVTIVVLAVHSLLLFRIAEAQTPRSNIELRAIKAQAGDEASVRDLAYSIFEPFGWANRDIIRDQVGERITRSELSYRSAQQPALREEDVVKAVNNLVSRVGAPDYVRTSLEQVRYLRTALMMRAPHLVAATGRSSKETELPRTMSPIEATYVTLSLIHQKLNNPKYQEDDNGASWLQRRRNETLGNLKAGTANSTGPKLLSVNSPRSSEIRKVVANVLTLSSAGRLPDMVLDDLGVSR